MNKLDFYDAIVALIRESRAIVCPEEDVRPIRESIHHLMIAAVNLIPPGPQKDKMTKATEEFEKFMNEQPTPLDIPLNNDLN